MTLENRISQLEDRKWSLILQGAEFSSILQDKIKMIDKKLNRLYSWLANGYMNGMDINSSSF